ncbi:hypothetical protein M3589_22615 [Heyndrickxia oleronia]|uniref:hypothetical protein n=1 Tax=Heyndrickxia oleronia TaxID=38875 RepID=UPI00203EADF2|nr:hypothetical protein [Heyndrickxia oleronia]MCM3240468.1 hypothetical protein [Heyndrickxia oleronia]
MNLFWSILVAFALGIILVMIPPVYGAIIAFGIIGGCLFRGIVLLEKLNKKLNVLVPDKNKVAEVYESYLNDKKKEF